MPTGKVVRTLTPEELAELGIGPGSAGVTDTEAQMLGPSGAEQIEPTAIKPLTAQGVAAMYPDIGGGIGGMIPGPAGIAGAALGGVLGETIRQLQNTILGNNRLSASAGLKRMGTEAVKQGLFEAVGRKAGKIVSKAAARQAGNVTRSAAIADARRLGIPLSAPDVSSSMPVRAAQTVSRLVYPGRRVIEEQAARVSESIARVGQQSLDQLGPASSPILAGNKIDDAWKVVEDNFFGEADVLYGQVTERATNVTVDTAPAFRFTEGLLKEGSENARQFPAAFKRSAEVRDLMTDFLGKEGSESLIAQAGGATPSVAGALGLKDPPKLTFARAHQLRSALLRTARDSGKQDAIAFAKQVSHVMDESMEAAAKAGPPGLYDEWRTANKFFKEGEQVIEAAVLRETATKAPEHVIKGLPPGDVSKLRNLKSAVIGLGKDRAAFDTFRRQWLANQLTAPDTGMVMDFTGLGSRMETWGKEFTEEMFDDATGRSVLANAKALAAAAVRNEKNLKGVGTGAATSLYEHGLLAGTITAAALGRFEKVPLAAVGYLVPAAIAKILYSKPATMLAVEGLKRLNQSKAMGPAVSLIERAIDVALKQKADVQRQRDAAARLEP